MKNIQSFLKHDTVSFINGSITNLKLLQSISKSIDGIFHQAAIASVPYSIINPIETDRVNIIGTLNVLSTARKFDIQKIVFASSSAIYGDTLILPQHENMIPNPLSPYAITKITGEYYMNNFSNLYGLKTVSLRYFNVFGPKQNPQSDYAAVIPKFITNILNNKPLTIFGDGEQTRDFTYVKDVVQANINSMNSSSIGTFNVACGKPISLNNLINIMKELTTKEIQVIYENKRFGDIVHSYADISKSQSIFSPKYDINTGLKETILWYMKQ